MRFRVWLGVSTEDQDAADERIPELLATPAEVRFLNCEPLLGPIDLMRWIDYCEKLDKRGIIRRPGGLHSKCEGMCGVSWVIIGCESGPGARPCDPEWIRSIVKQCRAAGVAVFVKQMVIDGKLCKHVNEFPEDLRIQEFPAVLHG